jgi:hypothetical protein
MRLFHRHSFSTFTCNANEIPGISFLGAKDIYTKEKIFLKGFTDKIKCDAHYGDYYFHSDGTCPGPGCNRKLRICVPVLQDILITYKSCSTCSDYEIKAQCGKYEYTINKEYVKLKIDILKKAKDDAEMERLLNIGNPDYKPSNAAPDNTDYKKIIEVQKEDISKLQSHLRIVLKLLNDSKKNDGIWEAIPKKVKGELLKNYSKNAPEYDPIKIEDLVTLSAS